MKNELDLFAAAEATILTALYFGAAPASKRPAARLASRQGAMKEKGKSFESYNYPHVTPWTDPGSGDEKGA